MNDRKWVYTRLIAWSVAAVALLAILLLGIFGKLPFGGLIIGGISGGYHYADADKYKSGGAKIDGDSVDSLAVDWIAGNIKIEAYDGDTVQFFEKSSKKLKEEDQLHYYNKNGRLIIRYKKSDNRLHASRTEKELTVKVPKETAGKLEYVNVDTISSDTKLRGIRMEEANLDSTSGNFELSDCQTEQLSMDSTSGKMTGESVKIGEQLEASTTSGDVEVEGSVASAEYDTVSGNLTIVSEVCPSEVRTDSVSGSVSLTIPENEGFTYTKDTVSGAITCDFDVSYKDDKGVYKNGDARYDFGSVSGDFAIKRK